MRYPQRPCPHCAALLLALLFLSVGAASLHGEFYFTGTDHQLEVIRIKGEKPGLTVLIFGGIHGDEPGGYFSSEILSKIKLIKGNLIIVPRVNFPSIMLNRREVNGDMNRKFVPQSNPNDPDTEVVELLKTLMKEADIFINQHDAYGFHRETYISPLYNKSRYGQSLIIDNARFYSTKLQKEIPLGEIGKRIMERVNNQIDNPDHHFGFWDHNSVDINTKFKEMKRSATYYALTTHSIPAFGLETSKDLPTLYHKVKYQLLVIREILTEFGLEFIFPPVRVLEPELYWVEFLKNGTDIIRVNGNTNLRLAPGDRVVIKHIFSNHEKGLSANISDFGTLNDMNKEFLFQSGRTVIDIKKNHLMMGKIYLKGYDNNSIRSISLKRNGTPLTIPNWGVLTLKPNDSFTIDGTMPTQAKPRFDVRGFSRTDKPGDAHTPITASHLLPQYSFLEQGKIYFVKIYNGNAFAGGFQIQIEEG